MFAISPSLALIALSVTPFLALFVFIMKGAIHRRWDVYQYKSANLNAYAHESFIGIKVTQAFVREKRNSRTMKEQLGQNYTSWMRAVNLSNVLFPAVLIFNTASITLIYWFGYRYLGLGRATLGSLIAFTSYVWMLTDPIVDLSNYYNDVLVALAAADRIFDYLDTPVAIQDGPDAHALPPVQGKVEFQDVRFGYDPRTEVLNRTSTSATTSARRCCTASASRWSPAPRWPSWDAPAPERARSSTCCRASTRSRGATSSSTATISAA
jgi:ATP-binding cassette, subfamily B, multidrug efflux pump